MTVKKPYDLEARTLQFAKAVRKFVRRIPRSTLTADDCRQLLKASGSVGANYREANDSLSRKDFRMRVKICRKEAKESAYWLELVEIATGDDIESQRRSLLDESAQLMKIFGAILRNTRSSE